MNLDDKQTTLEVLSAEIEDLKRRIDIGETGLSGPFSRRLQLQYALRAELEAAEDKDADEDPLLKRLRVKRSYRMSPAALEARQQNAQKSTGPQTSEGKDASARNSWKHGQHARRRVIGFGKPCKSTCPQYPCSLVEDGAVQPGQDCQDKAYFAATLNAISKALNDGDLTDMKEVVTLQLGGTLQVIEELQASILENGVFMKSEKLGKEGQVLGYELKPNPSLLPLSNLLKAAGVTLPDFMITPAAIERKKTDDDTREGLADIFRVASEGLTRAREKKDE
ncbi:hypothetical protein [Geopsychrobacter electrodiphilus]|uniref:hypothetical protein n=1 Tax=Geopsychrobacter electrodiphilus TaxID=225196 RepID=UPI0003781820|nr:hypothetical protein [Geopsychrobacter electrodiphilus]